MLYEHESVFYPNGPDRTDFDWYKHSILCLPTEELIEALKECEARLEMHRHKEPPRKRKNKAAYKAWVQRSHDYLDMIMVITQALDARRKQEL